MRWRRQLLRGALLLLGLLALPACSRPASDQPRALRFAIIPKALHIPVFDYARTGAEREAKRLGGIDVPATVETDIVRFSLIGRADRAVTWRVARS